MWRLIIGNRNYSSWSLRPWLFLRLNQVDFDTQRIALYTDTAKAEITQHSPAGKVPVLIDGDIHVWDSLAICEYAIERLGLPGWPAETKARAQARSLVAEMHSGFGALRNQCPMNCRRAPALLAHDAAAAADIRRVDAIWTYCREQSAAHGPGLFGDWSLVDAFYAPVVLRFHRFCLPCSEPARRYMDAVLDLPAMQEWVMAAQQETEVLPQFEV